MANFLYSWEGVTQGGPLAMVTYFIGVIPLIKLLKEAYTNVIQSWYSDDTGELGTLNKIGLYFNLLKRFVPERVYYPEPLKNVLIVHPDIIVAGKEFGLCKGFKVCTGARYMVNFIGDEKSKHDWLKY